MTEKQIVSRSVALIYNHTSTIPAYPLFHPGTPRLYAHTTSSIMQGVDGAFASSRAFALRGTTH